MALNGGDLSSVNCRDCLSADLDSVQRRQMRHRPVAMSPGHPRPRTTRDIAATDSFSLPMRRRTRRAPVGIGAQPPSRTDPTTGSSIAPTAAPHCAPITSVQLHSSCIVCV